VRWSETKKEAEVVRRPTKERIGTKGTQEERQRCTHEQTNSVESEQVLRTESSIMSVAKERMNLLFTSRILRGDCHLVEEFFNCESRRVNNDQSQRDNKGTERIQKQLTRHQRNSTKREPL
jgi:hypothetical protein